MKIEEGKYYKTRDGRKVGPMRDSGHRCDKYVLTADGWMNYCTHDGQFQSSRQELDLIAEWTEGPVVTETVTKTRIVPGVYDRVHVSDSAVTVFVDYGAFGKLIAADQLDAAAAVLSALAKGLRDA